MLEGSRNSIEVTAGQADPCPECGETDWATTERFIDPLPWWTRWVYWPEARRQKRSA
jgi:hypothetical protein